jgi:predicted transcriptional regulator
LSLIIENSIIKPDVRALSIKQPHAENILAGHKTEEYRSRPTKILGKVYIYASLQPDCRFLNIVDLDSLPKGVIVGTVVISGCKKVRGGYAWLLSGPVL